MLAIKDMAKMASHESSESSTKSSIPDKVNTTAQSKTDEKKSSTASSSGKQHELNDTAADTKEKNLTSDATDEHISVQKNDSDNIKSENKDNLKLLVIEKKDDSKMNNKQETQNVASLVDLQSADEKEIKSEDNKDSLTKGGSVSKRKRKTVRLVQCLHREIT